MTTAVMTSKGQITIPKSIRDRLGVDTGDRVEFVELEQGGFAVMPASRDIRTLKGLIPSKKTVSVAEMNKAIRARAAKK